MSENGKEPRERRGLLSKRGKQTLNSIYDTVGDPIMLVLEEGGAMVKKLASSAGDAVRSVYHDMTTPRYTKNRKQVIHDKMYKNKRNDSDE